MLTLINHSHTGSRVTQRVEVCSIETFHLLGNARVVLQVPLEWLRDMNHKTTTTDPIHMDVVKTGNVSDPLNLELVKNLRKEIASLRERIEGYRTKENRTLIPKTPTPNFMKPDAVRSRVREAVFIRVFEAQFKCGVPMQTAANEAKEAAILASVTLEPTP